MNQPITIAHIFFQLHEAELLAWINLFIKRSDQKEFNHIIVNIDNNPSEQTKIHLNKFQYINIKTESLSTISLTFKIKNSLQTVKPNFIQSHHPIISSASTLCSILMRIKSIHTCHDAFIEYYQRSFWTKYHQYCLVSSEYIRTKLIEKKWINEKKIKLIYNGIDVYTFDQSKDDKLNLKNQLGLDPQSYIIGNMGSLIKEEDQGTLIKAFRKLALKNFHMQLIFTGDGPLLEELKDLVNDFDLNAKVKFAGHKLTKEQYFKIFDVLVDSSFNIKYPYLLLEAMSSAIPVVATKIGATPEIVVERDTGWIVPCGFPERIESAIMKLTAIKTLSAEMGQKAKEHVHSKFNINKITSEYEQLYTRG